MPRILISKKFCRSAFPVLKDKQTKKIFVIIRGKRSFWGGEGTHR
jgi:hypothetical protein